MIVDAREIEDGSTLSCDLAIVGAGAAGITIARAVAGGSAKVCLIESGGLEYDEAVQDLYQGQNTGLPYFDLDVCRLRYFGGSTNHWAGRCRPLDPSDFEARPWVPLSGWPIGAADLEPYYRQAQEICGLGAFDYAPEGWLAPGQAVLPFDPAKVTSRLWQYAPTRFGEVYGEELRAAENVEVLLHASLVEIESNEAGSQVTGLRLATLEGRRLLVRPRLTVLACGGLETPRLLLASNRTINVGLGNQNDMVGRCFMEHPHANAARALMTDPAALGFYTYGEGGRAPDGLEVVGCLNLGRELQAEREVLNFDALFTADSIGDSGFAALRRIVTAAGRGELPDDLSADLWQALTDIDDTVAGLLGRLGVREYQPNNASFLLWCSAEQAPERESRVTLGDERDALGLPRIRLDWRLSELDRRTLRAGHEAIAEELGRTGLGRLQIEDWLLAEDGAWPPSLEGGHHHMGTLRMSNDPRNGVVDRDCRLHGIDNLYVAGSAVFPTSGAANPTLTIVALAQRLAGLLAERLQG